jgi:hypothetical protein
MRKLLILGLIAIIFVSGCINLGGTKALFGILEVTDNPDVYLKVDTSTDEVKSGRMAQLQFTLSNKGTLPMTDISVNAYDLCLFIGNTSKNITELKANRTSVWLWSWNATDAEFERDCNIKFRTTYETQSSISKTVNVLKESEYYSREANGRLGEVPTTTISSDNSLAMTVEFSEDQPFLENEDVYAYINYNDVGPGILSSLDRGNVIINVSSNLEGTCSGYRKDGARNAYILDSTLRFANKKAPSTTCTFKTKASQLIESGEIRITATYKYQFDNSLLLKVKPK